MNISNKAISLGLLLAGTIITSAQAQAPGTSASPAGALGSSWADAAKLPDLFTGMWMTFSPMTEGKAALNVPYTEKAQKYVDAYKPVRDIPYAQDGCLPPGLPIAMRTGPVKFSYTPGLISIYMQGVGDSRFIKLNQPMGPTTPKFYGNSVGRFEGDTLVIETKDFLDDISFQYGVGKGLPMEEGGATTNQGLGGPPPGVGPGGPGGEGAGPGGPGLGGPGGPERPPREEMNISRAIWGPHGQDMHMVERLRLLDANTLEMQLTLYDDTVWKRPYIGETRTFRRIVKGASEIGPFTGEPEEWVCTVSITSFDPATNEYVDKDPEDMVKFLDKSGD